MKKLIIAIFLLFIMNNVNASVLDTNVKIEWVPNVYYNYENNGIKYWGQFGYIYADNEIVYCMDISNIITTNLYLSSTNINVSKDIAEIVYFGYGYNSNNKLEDYMATQQLVWEYQGTNSYFTTQSEGKGNVINVDTYKNKIKGYKDIYNISPKFNKTFDFELGSTNTIIDTNNVLNNFIIGNNKRNDISIENNSLIVKATVGGEGNLGIVTNYSSRGDNKTYYADNSQSLIKINSISNKSKVYRYMVYSGDVRVNLFDNISKTINSNGAGTLFGNIFKLYNSNNKLIGTYESSKDGTITIYDLSIGNYVLEHSVVSEGYVKNKTMYDFQISTGDIHEEINIYLNPLTTTLNIRSTYGNPSIGTVYGNIGEEYIIKNNKNEIVDKIITNNIGEATINLIYNEYKIFKNNSDEIDSYVISKNNFNKIHNYNIFTPIYTAKLKIHLFQSGTTIPIKNINFKLNKKEYVTNNEGIIVTDYLEIGKYLLEEEIPNGYYKVDNTTIEIDENSIYYIENNDIYIDVFIYNEKIQEVELELISNGGKIDNDRIKILETDMYGVLPIPEKENSNFIGWYTKDGIKITEKTTYIDVLENKLYAKYELIYIEEEKNNNESKKEEFNITDVHELETKEKEKFIENLNIGESKIFDDSVVIEESIDNKYDYREILEEEKIDNKKEEASSIKILPNLGICNNRSFYLLIYLLRKNEKNSV